MVLPAHTVASATRKRIGVNHVIFSRDLLVDTPGTHPEGTTDGAQETSGTAQWNLMFGDWNQTL